jgi:hypothetical protein
MEKRLAIGKRMYRVSTPWVRETQYGSVTGMILFTFEISHSRTGQVGRLRTCADQTAAGDRRKPLQAYSWQSSEL